jgi:hypothetical protein
VAGSAQRPKKPESSDGCVSRMLSLQLQKSPTPDFEEKCGNSPDTSKGISQLGMCKFESSEVKLAVQLAEFSALAAGELGMPSPHCRAEPQVAENTH